MLLHSPTQGGTVTLVVAVVPSVVVVASVVVVDAVVVVEATVVGVVVVT
jgi:hypothetical protein